MTCACEQAEYRAHSFFIEINNELKSRIVKLAGIVREHNAVVIEEFNFSGKWSSQQLEQPNGAAEIQATLEVFNQYQVLIQSPRIRVTKNSFHFISFEKYCGDDMALRTRDVDISSLNESTIYADLID